MDPVEEIIKRAQERGDFDNLAGQGKPLDLRENPFVPAEWQLAYRWLAGSGYAPDVVEDDKALRARIADLDARLDRFARRYVLWPAAERHARQADRAAFLGEYEEEMRAINNRIHAFNASAPRAMQRGTLPVARLRAAAERRLPLP